MRALRTAILCGLVATTAPLPLAAQESAQDPDEPGYRVTSSAVIVSGDMWRGWQIPDGAYRLTENGAVEPRYLAGRINAIANAGEFETIVAGNDTITGGVSDAGTASETAPNIGDGRVDTWWEPAADDELEDWYVEINLGRTVTADSVRVRFVDEGMGDPFLKFRVLLSDGEGELNPRVARRFFRAGQVAYPNKDERVFVFAVPRQRPVPDGVTGEPVQIVRFEGLDTDGPRAAVVDSASYARLDSADRGAIDYFRATVTGRQIPVSAATYALLSADERGDVIHYRHERPRLAELEVITAGENIVTVTQRRLHRVTDTFTNIAERIMTDGHFYSTYVLSVWDPIRERNNIEIDLGAKFWLDRVRILSPGGPPSAYQVRVSDGSLDPTGTRLWETFEERLNREGYLQLEERFPLQEVQLIDLRRLDLVGATTEQANIAEIQAYGEGYVSEVLLTSPIIQLGRSRMITDVRWEGTAPRGTRLELRTRSGEDLRVEEEYDNRYGQQITQQQWNTARPQNRGPVFRRELPGPGWSHWSEEYVEPGQRFGSPSPRPMAMVQVRLRTLRADQHASIRGLRLGLAPPLVDQVYAEVWPVRGVRPGEEAEFELFFRPVFLPGNPGFDAVHLRTNTSAAVELVGLHAGTEAQLRAGGGADLLAGAELRQEADGTAVVQLAAPVVRGGRVYRARVCTRLFLTGTTFAVELTRQDRPGIVQQASAGDAVALVPSQSLLVTAELADVQLLEPLRVTPAVVTPNGDGINDAADIRFEVYRARGGKRFEVGVFDLAGRRVRDLGFERPEASGEHAVRWDGRDDGGATVPPGIYVVRVRFAADAASAATVRTRVVHVAY